MAGCGQVHTPVRPSTEICDVTTKTYQVHERASAVHDDSLRPFNPDEEEKADNESGGHDREITYDPHVELEGESGEAEKPHVVKDPGMPTAKEIAEHEITHLPHRSWCAACVAGRSRDRPHKRLNNRDCQVPTIVFDYGFMGGER